MNPSAVFLLLVAALVAVAFGFPSSTDDFGPGELRLKVWEPAESLDVTPEEGESGARVRRATCDLLSVSTPIGSLNHAACAAHCLAKRKGYKGGRCKSGVCHCRK